MPSTPSLAPQALLATESEREPRLSLGGELWVFIKLFVPNWISLVAMIAMNLTDLAVIGHYMKGMYQPEMAFATIVISFFFRVCQGGSNTVQILAAQAYGAKNLPQMGRWLQCGYLWTIVSLAAVSPFFFLAGKMMQALVGAKQIDDHAAGLITTYATLRFIGFIPAQMNSCLDNYLQSQKIVRPQMIVNLSSVLVNLGLQFLLIYGIATWDGFGYAGSALGTTFSRLYAAIVLGSTTVFFQWHKKTWAGWERAAISRKRMCRFVGLAIPQTITNVAEEAQLAFMSVLAGRLGKKEEAAHTVQMNMLFIVLTMVWSLGQASQIRVSHFVAAGDIPKIKQVLRIAYGAVISAGVVVGIVLHTFAKQLATVYSDDEQVINLLTGLAPLVAASSVFIGVFVVSIQVLFATGRPKVALIAFICGTWLTGVPLSYFAAFKWRADVPGLINPTRSSAEGGTGLPGVWLGLLSGYSVTLVFAVLAVCRSKWPELIEDAQRRAEKGSKLILSDDEEVEVTSPLPA